MLVENRLKKVRKQVVLFSHEYHYKKCVEKNARNNFFRNTRIVRSKNVGKKSSGKCAKKRFLYSHEYRDLEEGGGTRAKQVFQKHTNSACKKCWEKNRRSNGQKCFFIFTRISWTKNVGENARNNLSWNTRLVRQKLLEKNLRKNAKKRFLYSHEYRDQNRGEKTSVTIFLETHELCEQKMLGKNRRKKVRKNVFYIHTNIITKKCGEKLAKQFFQKITNSASKKCWKKIFGKKCKKKVFFINTNIVSKKWGGKTRETILPATPE